MKESTKQKIRETFKRRAAKGLVIGRQREFDPNEIRELRAQGLSYTEIADELGCSTWPVQKALKGFDFEVPKKTKKKKEDF